MKLWLLFTKPCFLFPITSHSHVPTNSFVYYSSWFDRASTVLELLGELLGLGVLCLFILLIYPKLLHSEYHPNNSFSFSAMILSWLSIPLLPQAFHMFSMSQKQMVLQGCCFFVLLSPGFAFESAEHKPFSNFTYLAVTYGAQPV